MFSPKAMAGLYFAVLFVCVHILTCAPVHNGETQNEKPNKLLNNTLAGTNETTTSCQSKLKEALIEMANYKKQKMDLQTWMSRISQAIVDQQQLMTKLHIDIDGFLGWDHSANGTLQFSPINESLVSNETDGTEDIDLWDDDFWPRRRAGWLTQQNMMTEGQIMPESPSEPKPGLVEPLEVVDYEEEEGGLSVQENENTAKEVNDNEHDPGDTAVSKEITEAPRKTDVTETPNTAKAHGVTETVPGTQQSSKPKASHHKTEKKELNESPDPLEPPEQEEMENINQAQAENEPPKTENEQLETENEPQEKENEPLETENEPQEKENEPPETENEPQEKENEPLETENEPQEKENEPLETEAQENEKNQQEQEEKESETEQQGEEGQQEALHIDEGPHKDTERYAHNKLGRKLLGLETAETSNGKAEGYGAESKFESSQAVHDLKKRVDACLSVVTQREGFNKLHGMERYTEQNSVSQRLKVLECVLDIIKGMPIARQNIFMSQLQRFLETMEHWGQ